MNKLLWLSNLVFCALSYDYFKELPERPPTFKHDQTSIHYLKVKKGFLQNLQTFFDAHKINEQATDIRSMFLIKDQFQTVNFQEDRDKENKKERKAEMKLMIDFLYLCMDSPATIEEYFATSQCAPPNPAKTGVDFQKKFTIFHYFDSKRSFQKLLIYFERLRHRAMANIPDAAEPGKIGKNEISLYARSVNSLFDSYPRLYRLFNNYYNLKVKDNIKKLKEIDCSVLDMSYFYTYMQRLDDIVKRPAASVLQAKREQIYARIYQLKLDWSAVYLKISQNILMVKLWANLFEIQTFQDCPYDLAEKEDYKYIIRLYQVIMHFSYDFRVMNESFQTINKELQRIENELKKSILELENRDNDKDSAHPMMDFTEYYKSSSVAGVLLAMLAIMFL